MGGDDGASSRGQRLTAGNAAARCGFLMRRTPPTASTPGLGPPNVRVGWLWRALNGRGWSAFCTPSLVAMRWTCGSTTLHGHSSLPSGGGLAMVPVFAPMDCPLRRKLVYINHPDAVGYARSPFCRGYSVAPPQPAHHACLPHRSDGVPPPNLLFIFPVCSPAAWLPLRRPAGQPNRSWDQRCRLFSVSRDAWVSNPRRS
jgi:hypothetical protein